MKPNMQDSNFNQDLSKEAILGDYLVEYYTAIFEDSPYTIMRNTNLSLQHKGVDWILKNDKQIFYVDEKAQLDYLNKSLPTFAFELSYLKHKEWRQGWLFDNHKLTHIYFLVTGIHTVTGQLLTSGLTHIRITGIYRNKLIALLAQKGLYAGKILELEQQVRAKGKHGSFPLSTLHPRREGKLYYSKNNKKEAPINLVLKLDFLIREGVGKDLLVL